jgi:hypothetical protein
VLGATQNSEKTLSYPFDNNPFEIYFLELRKWRGVERSSYQALFKARVNGEDYSALAKKFTEASERIKSLKQQYTLPKRDFDIYLGEVDLALEEYEREFPKQEKPLPCSHSKTEIRLRSKRRVGRTIAKPTISLINTH